MGIQSALASSRSFTLVVVASIGLPALAQAQTVAESASRLARLPGGFVENRGQEPDAVRFHGRQGRLHLWATEAGLTLGLPAVDQAGRDTALELHFGAGQARSIEGRAPLDGPSHFLRAGEESVVGAVNFAEVLYRELAPGLDLRLKQTDGAIEYDLELAPGATLDGFSIEIAGASGVHLVAPDELRIETPAGPLIQRIPAAWQVRSDGEREALSGRFVLQGDDRVGFALEGRDPSLAAVLDPVLGFAGYIGGSACDFVQDVALDSLHRSFVVGISQSADFPTSPGVIDTTWLNDEAFLASFDPSGTNLRFATFLGGSGDDVAHGLDIDLLGERVWIVGETESADFPVTPGAFDIVKGDFEDAFVARVSADGTLLDWATFLGGNNSDRAVAITVEATGRSYLVGTTSSTDFPVTPGVGQPGPAGGSDAFVAKLSASGASLLVSTYFGGSNADEGTGVVTGFGGELIVAGTTRSDDIPTSVAAVQPARAGGDDGFIARLSANGGSLVYGTYLGGSGDDRIASIATWPAQTIYAVGVTESADFPTTVGALFTSPQGLDDAFVSVISADGSGFVHSTYLGGSGNDAATDVALDPVGTTYVVGTTTSPDLPVTGDAFQSTLAGGSDIFHFIVASDGTAIDFGTYYGGAQDDSGHGIDHDDFTGSACFGGHVLDGVPSSPGVWDPSFNGGSGDGFLVCYSPLPCPTTALSVNLGSPCSSATLTVPPLVQGSYITLTITGAPPNASGLLYTSLAGSPPLLWEGLCDIWINIFSANPFAPVFTDASGNWSLFIGLPNDAPRCDQKVTFQALVLDIAGGPLSFGQLTNGVECTFGS
ncbi:hypothetical protein [Engelhardtia mirabilis]|uniref:Beta-propeller repeat protein n=1 Tax=Engelhardtia mirabilis TaxID=2528011 RepID=A0A518BKU2_9BACT|nr:Beta-propeller repeat protein [Planctomycetes bacterium Pla133]QDV01921.1 Beta-propeller repeat protein [Planctomycetes bacterium Pla86]